MVGLERALVRVGRDGAQRGASVAREPRQQGRLEHEESGTQQHSVALDGTRQWHAIYSPGRRASGAPTQERSPPMGLSELPLACGYWCTIRRVTARAMWPAGPASPRQCAPV